MSVRSSRDSQDSRMPAVISFVPFRFYPSSCSLLNSVGWPHRGWILKVWPDQGSWFRCFQWVRILVVFATAWFVWLNPPRHTKQLDKVVSYPFPLSVRFLTTHIGVRHIVECNTSSLNCFRKKYIKRINTNVLSMDEMKGLVFSRRS